MDADSTTTKAVLELPQIDVDEELRKLVGLKQLKSEILAMRKELLLDKRRVDLGLEVAKPVPPHMVRFVSPRVVCGMRVCVCFPVRFALC